jgi:hypothetical protein
MLIAVGAALVCFPPPAKAQEAVSRARSAQARFERVRRQFSPVRNDWSGSDCDEHVGRLCLRYDEGGDWWPQREDARIVSARSELLDSLAAADRPTHPWILGQRVAYLAEAGRWSDAEALARACGLPDGPAWCLQLLGFALHGQGRFGESERAYREALDHVDERTRDAWWNPELVLDADAVQLIERAARTGDAERDAAISRVWNAADPLFLVEGNDRLTEHWARLTVATIREGATNGYGMSWGSDLEEVLVRYGWEIGWDRSLDSPPGTPLQLVGHQDPRSRRYMPPAEALTGIDDPSDWPLSLLTPRDGYAPGYAPVILPAPGEILRFPRGDRLVVVGVFAMPADTTEHAGHEHPRFQQLPRFGREPDQAGVFLMADRGVPALVDRRSADGRTSAEDVLATPVFESIARGSTAGALMVDAAAGRYLASVEVWSPSRGFAGRQRQTIESAPLPADVATISSVLLLDRPLPDDARLEDALPAALAPDRPITTQIVAGWELFGLGWAPDRLSYRVSLEPEGEGFVRRLGRLLRLSSREPPQTVEWEEAAPTTPGPAFRTVSMDVRGLEPGKYVLRIEVSLPGRTPLVAMRPIVISR